MKILIVCTGNTCRSQMAEGFLSSFDGRLEVYSAGTRSEEVINPRTVVVMKESGIDLSHASPKSIDLFLGDSFNYVITVCDGANEICPVFTGKVEKRLHMGFEDPASYKGSDEQVLPHYRRIRDEIKRTFRDFYLDVLLKELNNEQ